MKIEVTQNARMETNLGKAPTLLNGHQPPQAVYPYEQLYEKELFHLIKSALFCPQLLKLVQKCTKAGAICHSLSVNMLEGRF